MRQYTNTYLNFLLLTLHKMSSLSILLCKEMYDFQKINSFSRKWGHKTFFFELVFEILYFKIRIISYSLNLHNPTCLSFVAQILFIKIFAELFFSNKIAVDKII